MVYSVVSSYKTIHCEGGRTTPMIALVSLNKILPSLSGSPQTVQCSSCETAIRITPGDCPACGAAIAIECRDCGNTIKTETDACSDCGNNDFVVFYLE